MKIRTILETALPVLQKVAGLWFIGKKTKIWLLAVAAILQTILEGLPDDVVTVEQFTKEYGPNNYRAAMAAKRIVDGLANMA